MTEKIGRLNPLLEVLRSSPGRVEKILVDREFRGGRLGEALALARKSRVLVQYVPRATLDRVMPRHQGFVAALAPKAYESVEDILARAGERPFLLLLDEIEDPQNLGAILRSAEGAGVDGVVLPERRSAGLTDTVLTVSAGAAEHVRIARVVNLVRAMEDLKTRGVWLVGADKEGQGEWHDFDYTQPVGIVLGSEGRGLRPLVRKSCDHVLSIPQRGRVTSLNVGAAAAVFLYEVVRQRAARR
ncbi:MAG: 23S rRNA (guanosine(2251)-2'-O)-methyltransferase RlmB [Candidatus Aminicenantes bacterium]|nr:23S rRNA (guanosine(2251)-2'-O)-methyltransferase RlmB [Candidatus Aminicenantes bacterium]